MAQRATWAERYATRAERNIDSPGRNAIPMPGMASVAPGRNAMPPGWNATSGPKRNAMPLVLVTAGSAAAGPWCSPR